MKFDDVCEMNIGGLLNTLMGKVDSDNDEENSNSDDTTPSITQNPIQPTDNVGQFGNIGEIHIKETEEGGLEIDSKEMAIKLSSSIYEAIKQKLNKGEN